MTARAPSHALPAGGRAEGRLALGLGVALLTLGTSCGPETDAAPEAPGTVTLTSEEWAQDDRLRPLIQDCRGRGAFEVDTSDLVPVLVGKLERSQLDVLRNVREELARLGEPAIVELDRLVRRVYSDPLASPILLNALGVLQLSEAGGGEKAQELLRYCLGHPQETVRNAAIRALGKQAGPGIYEDLRALFGVSHDSTKEVVVTALYQADRKRFERDALEWMLEQKSSNVLRHAAALVAQGADAETAELFRERIAQVEDRAVRGYLVATQGKAAEPPEGVFGILEEMVGDEDAHVRLDALSALEHTDATELIAPVLISDPEPNLRLLSVGLLALRAEEKVARDALLDGMNDPDDSVREAALAALLEVGEPRARDTALAWLGASQREIGIATRALVGAWEANPGLAQRALDLLRSRFEEKAALSLSQRQYLLQAIAQVPGPESTRYLLELGGQGDEAIDRLPARRWLAMQASNTGPEGIAHLRQEWRTEEDPQRRFDLLWSASQGTDDATRAFLVEVLEAERSGAHERLFVAERLAREGPAREVAPRIKRANLRMSDRIFRPAMECLLWRWYG